MDDGDDDGEEAEACLANSEGRRVLAALEDIMRGRPYVVASVLPMDESISLGN